MAGFPVLGKLAKPTNPSYLDRLGSGGEWLIVFAGIFLPLEQGESRSQPAGGRFGTLFVQSPGILEFLTEEWDVALFRLAK